jgi:hypothetical protein
MRECRSSGSVEGVMGNHDSYSDRADASRRPRNTAAKFPDSLKATRSDARRFRCGVN